jgi:PAS domain S-box-containing protein
MLGRRALEQGLSILDIATAHHMALTSHLGNPDLTASKRRTISKQAGNFLAECLSPYEMAQRGFQETIKTLNSLNERLEDEVDKRTHALQESEQRYRTLIQVSPDGITVTDMKGHITLSNQQAACLHGFQEPAEELGLLASAFVAPEDLPLVTAMAQRVIETGTTQDLEYTLISKNGKRVPVEVRVTLLRDTEGNPGGFIGVVRDVSARKRAEEEKIQLIAENERQRQRLNTLVAQLPGVVWESWGEPDSDTQRIAFVSGYVEQMLGYSVQEWLSTPDFWLTLVHPDDRESAASNRAAIFASGEPGVNQFRWISKDGQTVWVETQSVVINDEAGVPVGLRGVTLDITRRKEAELRLETQTRQQAVVAELGQLALAETSLDQLIHKAVTLVALTLDVEFCELLELLADGSTLVLRDGVGWKEGFIGAVKVKTDEQSQAGYTLHSSEPVIVEELATESRFAPARMLTDHGIVSGITVIIHSDNKPYGILGAHTSHHRRFTSDECSFLQSVANTLAMAIKNRRLLESEASRRREAERNSEARRKIMAIVTHELRTPLTSIKGFATTLLADDVTWSAESQTEFIRTIDEEADKLGNLIEQLLDISRMETGGFVISPSEHSLNAIVAQAMGQLRVLTQQHELVINIPESLPPVLADSQRSGQVLVNLVENATKYAPPNTMVTVSAAVDHACVVVSVADQGRGIAPDEQGKVFQPFYRSEGLVKSRADGAGLGLFICQRLVEAQGGRIWIKQHTGPGAIIEFTLPLADVSERMT